MPMENGPVLVRSGKGLFAWMKWKMALFTYFLSISLPIAFYIICLLLVSIKRESSELLAVVMMIMLHPITMLPFGASTKIIGEFVSSKLFKTQPRSKAKIILSRLFTYSLNLHVTMIATLIYYLYSIWIAFQNTTNVNFTNKPFDQCACDTLIEHGHEEECVNEETQNSFQNLFLRVPMSEILLAFIVVSFTCHLIHSCLVHIPSPIWLIDFIFGSDGNHTNERSVSENHENKTTERISTNGVNIALGFLSISYIVIILTSPLYTFNLFKSANGKLAFIVISC